MSYRILIKIIAMLLYLWSWPNSIWAQPGLFPKIDAQARTYIKSARNCGLEVGILLNGKAYFSGYGILSKADRTAPDAHTLFELGALSSVFTGTMLAVFEDRGQILPNTTVQKMLPPGIAGPIYIPGRIVSVTVPPDSVHPQAEQLVTCIPDPVRGPQEIALCQLAYHASGLTCSCGDFYRWHPQARMELASTPPQDLPSADAFFQAAAAFSFNTAPGTQYNYSTIGMAYLGQLMAANQQLPFEGLLARTLTGPLGMYDTRVQLLPAQNKRLAPGHDKTGRPVPSWNVQSMAPAAGIKSTASDLLRFVKAHLQLIPGIPYGAALQARQGMIDAPFPGWKYPTQAAYGWLVSTDQSNRAITWMNGGTAGYRSFLAFDAQRQIGIVLLSNSQGDLTALGFRMLGEILK